MLYTVGNKGDSAYKIILVFGRYKNYVFYIRMQHKYSIFYFTQTLGFTSGRSLNFGAESLEP